MSACTERSANGKAGATTSASWGRNPFTFRRPAKPEVGSTLIQKTIDEFGPSMCWSIMPTLSGARPPPNFPLSDWDDLIAVNLSAVFRLSQLGGTAYAEGRTGQDSSISLPCSRFKVGFWCRRTRRRKGGVAQLTKALANEWASKGVNVNAIAPGYMTTDNTRALREDPQSSRQILDRISGGALGCGQRSRRRSGLSLLPAPATTSMDICWGWMAAGWAAENPRTAAIPTPSLSEQIVYCS